MTSLRSLLIATALILVAFSGRSEAQDLPPTLVVTDEVQLKSFHNQITLIGRTEARIHSRIVSEVSGRVIDIDAPEGNPIAKNKVLVSIDPHRVQYSLNAREAEAKQAQAWAELAERNFKRAKELFDQKLISVSTIDSIRVQAEIQRQRFLELSAERDQLALDLENCRIKAPYGGFTLRRLIDVGEWVDPGTEVYEMVDLSEITVVVDLPERYFGQLAIGSDVAITVSGSGPNKSIGKVTGIARSASEETHTFPVIMTVDNRSGRLGGGKLVRATLSLEETFTSFSVSKDAIVRQGLQTLVYTIADGKAVSVSVVESSTDGQFVAISGEGLKEGMPVVVRGNERIFPGSPVKVAGEEPQEAPEEKAPKDEQSSTTEVAGR